MNPTHLYGVYAEGKKYYTRSYATGAQLKEEDVLERQGVEYREWNPQRSKLGAYLQMVKDIYLREGQKVLYLGASTGTTVSHVSDIIRDGMVFGVDNAFRVMIPFVFLAEERSNIAPVFANALNPEEYAESVPRQVDLVFQDVAIREQTRAFKNNVDRYLKKGGFGLIAVKARSVDVTKPPKQVFKSVRQELEQTYTVVDVKELKRYQKYHAMIAVKK